MAANEPDGAEAHHDEPDNRNRDIYPQRPHELAPLPVAPFTLKQHVGRTTISDDVQPTRPEYSTHSVEGNRINSFRSRRKHFSDADPFARTPRETHTRAAAVPVTLAGSLRLGV